MYRGVATYSVNIAVNDFSHAQKIHSRYLVTASLILLLTPDKTLETLQKAFPLGSCTFVDYLNLAISKEGKGEAEGEAEGEAKGEENWAEEEEGKGVSQMLYLAKTVEQSSCCKRTGTSEWRKTDG